MPLPTINGEQNAYEALMQIDGSKVTTETGIPLMLVANLPGVKSGAGDVRLAKLDGTPIAREIEWHYTANDDVVIHYPFDTISGDDSQFYVYWGNPNLNEPAADSAYGSQAVWDNNHDSSYLLNDLLDSTSNGRNGTLVGTGTLVDSLYGKGYDFEGSTDYIHAPTGITAYPFTLMIQMELDTVSDYMTFVYLTDASDGAVYYGVRADNASPQNYRIDARGNGIAEKTASSTTDVSTTAIVTLHAVFSSATDRELFINGVSSATSTDSVTFDADVDKFLIGQLRMVAEVINTLDGEVLNARSYSLAITDNYALTTHNNLSNPTAIGTSPFYLSIGSIEHQRVVPQYM